MEVVSGSPRVNCHTHIYSGLAPLGMPPPRVKPENFVQILERVWWRLDRALDEETLRASARFYVAESLLAGTSTLVDHHESPNLIDGSLDILADACHELGIRALLCYGATERNGGRDEARRGLAECRRFIESNKRPGIVGAVALHASFTVSDDTIREAGELCRELNAIMHVHMAEDGADVDDAVNRGYAGPLERLIELGAVPIGSILAHGVHLTEEQVQLAAGAGLWLVQNPRSNRGNGVGYPLALHASDRVALGTDGYPARMDEEEAALWQEARAHGDELTSVTRRVNDSSRLVREVFGLGTNDRVERNADAVVSMSVGGRDVIRDRRFVSGDIDEIRAHASEQAARLWARMEKLV